MWVRFEGLRQIEGNFSSIVKISKQEAEMEKREYFWNKCFGILFNDNFSMRERKNDGKKICLNWILLSFFILGHRGCVKRGYWEVELRREGLKIGWRIGKSSACKKFETVLLFLERDRSVHTQLFSQITQSEVWPRVEMNFHDFLTIWKELVRIKSLYAYEYLKLRYGRLCQEGKASTATNSKDYRI